MEDLLWAISWPSPNGEANCITEWHVIHLGRSWENHLANLMINTFNTSNNFIWPCDWNPGELGRAQWEADEDVWDGDCLSVAKERKRKGWREKERDRETETPWGLQISLLPPWPFPSTGYAIREEILK